MSFSPRFEFPYGPPEQSQHTVTVAPPPVRDGTWRSLIVPGPHRPRTNVWELGHNSRGQFSNSPQTQPRTYIGCFKAMPAEVLLIRYPFCTLYTVGRSTGERGEVLGLLVWGMRWYMQCLGLLDPDPLVRGTDPDPSIIKQKQQEKRLFPAVL